MKKESPQEIKRFAEAAPLPEEAPLRALAERVTHRLKEDTACCQCRHWDGTYFRCLVRADLSGFRDVGPLTPACDRWQEAL